MIALRISAKLSSLKIIQQNKKIVEPVYKIVQDIRYHRTLKRNEILRKKYQGKRCFIFATGTSLLEVDLTKFKNEYTFGCNNVYKHNKFDNANFSFYTIADTARSLLARPATPEDDPVIYFGRLGEACRNKDIEFFFDVSSKPFIARFSEYKNKKIYYVASKGLTNDGIKLQTDLTKRIHFMDGVAYFMVTAAIYMGFKELYLLGCGWTYQPVQPGHFYDPSSAVENLDLEPYRKQKVQPLHFVMNKIAKEHDVKIYNVTPAGFESPVYEKISLNDVYAII